MPKTHLPFAKIVATPTPSSWSQAYGAGGLFVTLSLITEKHEHEESLGALGKKLLNDLEANFFAVEKKSLQTIKEAIVDAFSQIKDDILVSSSIAFVKDDILYGFLVGSGSLLLRREKMLGKLLVEEDNTKHEIQSASGRLKRDDLIILQTLEFNTLIGDEKLTESLESNNVEDIAEILSPLVHGKEEGAASAIFFTFMPQPETAPEEEEILPPPQLPLEKEQEEKQEVTPPPFTDNRNSFPHPTGNTDVPKRQLPLFLPLLARLDAMLARLKTLTHRQRMLLSIAGILIIVLLASILFTTKNTQELKSKEVFAAVFEPAKQQYEEGKSLIGLNTPLARESLEKADATLAKAEGKISPGSPEATRIAALKKDIQTSLEKTSGSKQAAVSPASDSASKLLTTLKDAKDRLYTTQDEDAIYFLTTKEIGSSQKSSGDIVSLVKNDDDWKSPAGLGTFLGNLYVLDKTAGILKFVKGSDGYGKSSYLTGEKPDFSKAVGLAIDGSIYILFSNGDIAKFTKGTPDTFKLSGLDTPFSSPTRIYTTPDFTSIYVLDNGNGRIVKLGKTGAYQEQYQAETLKKTKDFEVDESNKKAYFLSGSKIYEIQLQ